MAKRITEAEKAEIYALYEQGTSMCEIGRLTEHAQSSISRIIAERPTAERHCPKCHTVLAPGAKFCHMCGENCKTEAVKLCERLERLCNLFNFIPEQSRDEYIGTLNAAKKYVKEHDAGRAT